MLYDCKSSAEAVSLQNPTMRLKHASCETSCKSGVANPYSVKLLCGSDSLKVSKGRFGEAWHVELLRIVPRYVEHTPYDRTYSTS